MLQRVTKPKNGHGRVGHNSGAMRLYRSYMFKEKDPVIDRIRTIVEDEAIKQSNLSLISGVSSTTLHNWFEGETRRPQYATVAAVTTALGYVTEFVKAKKVNLSKEIEKAGAEMAAVKAKEERRKARIAT